MNYYNPYFYNMPYIKQPGLFERLFQNISFGKILNGTERTLNIVNQAIPIVKQVKPIVGNAKTMFKVMNELKKNENVKPIKKNDTLNSNINGPKFYI